MDGHIAVANTAALKAAEESPHRPRPARAARSITTPAAQPTGILRETARGLVESKIPPPTPARRRRATELALADAARWGITSAQDNSSWEYFLVYEDLEREGKLTLRISEWLTFDDPVSLLETHRAHHPANDPMLHTAMLKGFMDGSLGSRTAALLAPYSDDPGNSGLPQYEQDKLNRMAVERAAAGFQIGFHAIGDRAAQMALDAFAEAERDARENHADTRLPLPHRARPGHHARSVRAVSQARRHRLRAAQSSAHRHELGDGAHRPGARQDFVCRGRNSSTTACRWRSEPIIRSSRSRPFAEFMRPSLARTKPARKSYFPEQKLTIEQALAAYTTGSAYAQFAEKEKGTLAPGMLADFVVLDRDLTKVPPPEILKTQVLRTVVGGKTVYETN